MALPVLTIGSDFRNTATLKQNDVAVNIATAKSVKAVITNSHSNKVFSQVKTLSSSDTGADWTNGIIVFNFSSADTDEIKPHVGFPQQAMVEVEVYNLDNTRDTYYACIDIKIGNIV